MRHYNIPIFIPELACPFRCIYCNQFDISGTSKIPDSTDATNIIKEHLATITGNDSRIEIAFFGGNFTGISPEKQEEYLSIAQKYLNSGNINGIRISTRPDYINDDVLNYLKKYGVTAIEIGAQSMDDGALEATGRGHTSNDVKKAAKMIKKYSFELGIQMMTGLPGDSNEKAIDTARQIIALKADTARIYPTLILKNSKLEEIYLSGKYKPQSLEEAVELCAKLWVLFENAGINVLRIGLHPSEAFYDGKTLIAGPFHPAFGELVLTKVWKHKIKNILNTRKGKILNVFVNPAQLNVAIGHKAQNRMHFEKSFEKVVFHADKSLKKNQCYVDHS